MKKKKSYSKEIKNTLRLNQYLAHAGICSRREADLLIKAGVVEVNGKYITKMGYRVKELDIVKFNGRTLKSEKKQYLLLNKPRNYSCRLDNYGKRDSVFELIKNVCKEKVLPIGKLNKNTSGYFYLLMMRGYQNFLIRKNLKRTISLNNPLKSLDLKRIKDGLVIEGEKINIDSISYVLDKEKTEIGLELKSNKRNIVSKIFDQLNYKVLRLDLVFFGGNKKRYTRKKSRFLTENEINLLKRL